MRHMDYKYRLLLTIGLISYSILLLGQDTIYLNKYINDALDRNKSVLISRAALDISIKDIAITNSYKRPSIDFRTEYSIAEGGRKINFPLGNVINPIYNSLYQLTNNESLNRQFNDYEEQLFPHNFYRIGFTGTWSIFNTSLNLANKKAVKAVDIKKLEHRILIDNLKKEIKLDYLQLIKLNKIISIQNEVENYLIDLKEKTSRLISKGFAEKIDVDFINYEIEKHELYKEELISKLRLAKEKFCIKVGYESYTDIILDSDSLLIQEIIPLVNKTTITPNRKELSLLDLKNELISDEIAKEKEWRKPDIGLVTRTGFEGFLDNLSIDNYYINASIAVSWNLYNGKERHHNIQKKTLEQKLLFLEKEQLTDNIKLQLLDKLHQMDISKQRLQLQKRKSDLTRKTLQNSRKKYLQGDIDIIDLFKYKVEYEKNYTEFHNTRIEYLESIVEYNWAAN